MPTRFDRGRQIRLVNRGQFETGYTRTERCIADWFDCKIHRFLLCIANARLNIPLSAATPRTLGYA